MERVLNKLIDASISDTALVNFYVIACKAMANISYSLTKKDLPRKKKKKLKKTIDSIGETLNDVSGGLEKNILYMSLIKEYINPKRTITKITL